MPLQVATLPEALPLDTTSPLATAAAAPHPFDFRQLDGLTAVQQEVSWLMSMEQWM
jgi:hypothetical protein